jgi:hypothetical protein
MDWATAAELRLGSNAVIAVIARCMTALPPKAGHGPPHFSPPCVAYGQHISEKIIACGFRPCAITA